MRFKLIGPTTFTISAIGLGDLSLLGATAILPDESMRVVKSAFERNINIYHTNDWSSEGKEEILLGQAVSSFRENILLATSHKVHGSPQLIEASFHNSCARLKTETLDIYYLSEIDEGSLKASMTVMRNLLTAGKIQGIGLSNVSAALIEKAYAICPITAVQIEYSLWDRSTENDDVLATCKRLGIACFSTAPLGKDRITLSKETISPLQHSLFKELQTLASSKGVSPNQLALAWLISQNCTPLPGAINVEQLIENCKADDIVLSTKDLAVLNAMSLNR
ncbi:MAG: aldo/keto reductase [Gammaproteobacteria bacterium]|nr:aldo/keto reductase [Gammaproteobacteria bacterium]